MAHDSNSARKQAKESGRRGGRQDTLKSIHRYPRLLLVNAPSGRLLFLTDKRGVRRLRSAMTRSGGVRDPGQRGPEGEDHCAEAKRPGCKVRDLQ